MTSKFEQLIEYVINDEEAKAQELFHDIVVEKSREIYENLMNEEEEEELDESEEEELDESEEEELDESEEEDLDEDMGGDASDDLIDDVESEEQGMQEDEEEDESGEEEFGHEEGNETEHDIEDRVIDLEDKLDELMAEFEAIMGGEEHGIESDLGGEEGDEVEGDSLEMDDTQEFAPEMMENVKLDAAPKPVTGEESFVNKKATYAVDSGKAGMQGEPVRMTGDIAHGRSAPKTGDLPDAGQFKNVPGKGGANAKLAAAPKPVTAQASGVNTKSPVGKA
jgi:hypothetical protein